MLFTPGTIQHNLAVTSDTTRKGTSVAADSSPHTKGAWTTLIASTDEISYGFELQVRDVMSAGADTGLLIDIAYGDDGTGGNEVIVVNNINGGGSPTNSVSGKRFFFPPTIPADKSVRARIQATIADDTALLGIALIQDPVQAIESATVVTYGAVAASSRGTLVASGANDYGSWVEIADTTADHAFWAIGIDPGGDTSQNTRNLLIQLGTGADSGSVVAFPLTFMSATGSAEEAATVFPLIARQATSSGAKLWARVCATGTDDIPGVIVYGITLSTDIGGGEGGGVSRARLAGGLGGMG